MAKKADKHLVHTKLQTSINYCNSHHDPAQTLFEAHVDEAVARAVGLDRPERRAHEMKCLFPILQSPETRGFVPSIRMDEGALELDAHEFLAQWFDAWIAKFLTAWKGLPSDRTSQSKRAVTDPALVRMVLPHAGSMERAIEWAASHNLYMSAENIGGNLLEQYIAMKTEPYGWIWARGEILTAIDFCNETCTSMFQVKNKSNTENSSGKGFREERGADRWFRMRAEKRGGEIVTYWPQLVEIVATGAISPGAVPDDLMCEDEYLDFVEAASRRNSRLITAEES